MQKRTKKRKKCKYTSSNQWRQLTKASIASWKHKDWTILVKRQKEDTIYQEGKTVTLLQIQQKLKWWEILKWLSAKKKKKLTTEIKWTNSLGEEKNLKNGIRINIKSKCIYIYWNSDIENCTKNSEIYRDKFKKRHAKPLYYKMRSITGRIKAKLNAEICHAYRLENWIFLRKLFSPNWPIDLKS